MYLKNLKISYRMLLLMILLRRLPDSLPIYSDIQFELMKRLKGYRGEKNLKYFLGLLPEENIKIFFNLKLKYEDYEFQIDTLIIFPTFILIIEVKNFSGTITFEKYSDQFIRSFHNKEETFSNPILQVQRHKLLLEKFLKQHGFPSIPIEYLVAISDPTTQIRVSGNNQLVYGRVIHAEKVLMRIDEIMPSYKNNRIHVKTITKLCSILLKNDLPEESVNAGTYKLSLNDVNKGVICPVCFSVGMVREKAIWRCKSCNTMDKQAHIQAVLDLFLLKGAPLSNLDFQDFLKLPNRRIVYYLLKEMNLSSTGKGRGCTYNIPSIEYYLKYYPFTKEERKLIL